LSQVKKGKSKVARSSWKSRIVVHLNVVPMETLWNGSDKVNGFRLSVRLAGVSELAATFIYLFTSLQSTNAL